MGPFSLIDSIMDRVYLVPQQYHKVRLRRYIPVLLCYGNEKFKYVRTRACVWMSTIGCVNQSIQRIASDLPLHEHKYRECLMFSIYRTRSLTLRPGAVVAFQKSYHLLLFTAFSSCVFLHTFRFAFYFFYYLRTFFLFSFSLPSANATQIQRH